MKTLAKLTVLGLLSLPGAVSAAPNTSGGNATPPPVTVVDAAGKTVGRLVPSAGGGSHWAVMLNLNKVPQVLPLAPDADLNTGLPLSSGLTWELDSVFNDAPDCSGQTYVPVDGGAMGIGGTNFTRTLLRNGSWLAVIGAKVPPQQLRPADGTCTTYGIDNGLFCQGFPVCSPNFLWVVPVDSYLPLTTFTPPFHYN